MRPFARSHLFPLLMVVAFASQAASAAAPAAAPATRASDPWATVPAWPTSCYSSQDKFPDQVNTARETVQAGRSRQEEINKSATTNTGSGGPQDPMAMAQRVQEAMMKDPQHAMEQMQSMGVTDPAATQQKAQATLTRYEQVKAGDKTFIAEFKAARKAMLEPASARMHELATRANKDLVHTEAGDFWPEWANKEAGGIMQVANAAYTPFCAKWFGAGGKVPAYLSQRKNFYVSERIPALIKMDATATAEQMMGGNAEGYRSLAPYDAVYDYLGLAYDLFGLRTPQAASCNARGCEDQFGLMNF